MVRVQNIFFSITFDRNVKFKLSLVMIRNIDRLRAQGVMVSGSWLNKKVLMINETI